MQTKFDYSKLLFFTYVNEKYYHFVLPYVFSIAQAVPECSVEVVVQNKQKFYDLYGKKISNLVWNSKVSFFSNFWVSNCIISEILEYDKNFDIQKIIPNTVRFLLESININSSKYTYITDCDMLITQSLLTKAIENNISQMEKNKACFFNIKRENREALSGIHFVKNEPYYKHLKDFLKVLKLEHKDDFVKDLNRLSDEGFLYAFVNGAFGDVEKLVEGNERILPGMHLSPNRNKKYMAIKEELIKDPAWEYGFLQFGQKFLNLF